MARTAEQIIRDMLAQKDITIAQMAAQMEVLQEQLAAAKPTEKPRLTLAETPAEKVS